MVAASGTARLIQMPLAKATMFKASQPMSSAAMAVSPARLRRQVSRPTSSMGSATAIAASASRTLLSRRSPSPVSRCEMAVDTTSTPGITGSKGVGKTSPPPVTVAPMTATRSRTASAGSRPSRRSAALKVGMVPRGP